MTIKLSPVCRLRGTLCGLLVSLVLPGFGAAQQPDPARQGPYARLAIVNAMVIPGHGGPAYGREPVKE